MSIRALFAAIIALAILVTGAVLAMAREDAGYGDFLALLQWRQPDAALLCVLAAWGAVGAGALAVLTAFAAFLDEDEDAAGRRRGFPKGIPAILVLISLGLFWAALRCAARAAPAAPEPPVAAEPAPLVAPEPEPEPDIESAPPILSFATSLQWEYMDPLVRGETYIASETMTAALADLFPIDDPSSDVRRLLCGKAWVAFMGAASEEGPRVRNERRARIRAELTVARAQAWLDAHEADCLRPVVLGVALGQHVATSASLADQGAQTGYQRQALGVSRDAAPGESLAAAAAAEELRAYLADAVNRQALLGERRYLGEPEVFAP